MFGGTLIPARGLVLTMTQTEVAGKSKRPSGAPARGPFESLVLTGDETVDQVMTQHPALRLAMMSYGLCTCCSGSLTLRQSAAARGIRLDVILADLQREIANGA